MKQPVDRAPNRPTLPKPLEVRFRSSWADLGLASLVAEVNTSKYPPWCRPPLNICRNRVSRKGSSAEELRLSFLEHSHVHADSYALYTDGSKTNDGVGFAVVTADSALKKKKRLPPKTCFYC